jgi:hypothetical protein
VQVTGGEQLELLQFPVMCIQWENTAYSLFRQLTDKSHMAVQCSLAADELMNTYVHYQLCQTYLGEEMKNFKWLIIMLMLDSYFQNSTEESDFSSWFR